MILDSKLLAEISKGHVIELSSIFGHQDSRYPKSAYNALPKKVFDILLCDLC